MLFVVSKKPGTSEGVRILHYKALRVLFSIRRLSYVPIYTFFFCSFLFELCGAVFPPLCYKDVVCQQNTVKLKIWMLSLDNLWQLQHIILNKTTAESSIFVLLYTEFTIKYQLSSNINFGALSIVITSHSILKANMDSHFSAVRVIRRQNKYPCVCLLFRLLYLDVVNCRNCFTFWYVVGNKNFKFNKAYIKQKTNK